METERQQRLKAYLEWLEEVRKLSRPCPVVAKHDAEIAAMESEAQARRAALLEEVVEAIEYAQQVMHLFANPLGFNDNSQARQKYADLIARVRAEWGQA